MQEYTILKGRHREALTGLIFAEVDYSLIPSYPPFSTLRSYNKSINCACSIIILAFNSSNLLLNFALPLSTYSSMRSSSCSSLRARIPNLAFNLGFGFLIFASIRHTTTLTLVRLPSASCFYPLLN